MLIVLTFNYVNNRRYKAAAALLSKPAWQQLNIQPSIYKLWVVHRLPYDNSLAKAPLFMTSLTYNLDPPFAFSALTSTSNFPIRTQELAA